MSFATEALKVKTWSCDLKEKFLSKTTQLSEYQQVDVLNLMDEAFKEGQEDAFNASPDCSSCDQKIGEPQHSEGME